jgi:hypothetical protein
MDFCFPIILSAMKDFNFSCDCYSVLNYHQVRYITDLFILKSIETDKDQLLMSQNILLRNKKHVSFHKDVKF